MQDYRYTISECRTIGLQFRVISLELELWVRGRARVIVKVRVFRLGSEFRYPARVNLQSRCTVKQGYRNIGVQLKTD